MDVNAAETARIPNRIVLVKRIVNVVNRIAVVSVGFILGLITLMPNLMMSDSGTSIAVTATYVGVVASGCMVVGGIVGAVRGTPWAGWLWLLPGVAIEIFLFATLAISGGRPFSFAAGRFSNMWNHYANLVLTLA